MPNTIFDFLHAALVTKNASIYRAAEDDAVFSPFMFNRWVSMHSPILAQFVNDTTNRIGSKLSKTDFFRLSLCILPRTKSARITYIKKTKAPTKSPSVKETDNVEHLRQVALAESHEISMREVKERIELLAFLKSPAKI